MYHLVNRHAVTQHARDEFGIIPELAVELITQSLYRGLEPAGVDELEIVTFAAVGLHHFDHFPFRHGLWQGDTHLVIRQTGEDLVRTTVFQAHEGNPFIFLVLEAHHVAFQFYRSLQ